MHLKYSIWGNEKTLRETCIQSVFQLLTYQNAKRHGKQYVEKITLPKTSIFCVFERVT